MSSSRLSDSPAKMGKTNAKPTLQNGGCRSRTTRSWFQVTMVTRAVHANSANLAGGGHWRRISFLTQALINLSSNAHRFLNAGHRENTRTIPNPSQTEQESEIFLLKKGMYQDVSVIGCHPEAPEQRQTKWSWQKKSAYDKIERKWTKTGLPFYRGWLRSRSNLR